MTASDFNRLINRLFLQYQVRNTPAVPAVAYMVALVMDLEKAQQRTTLAYLLPLLFIPVGLLVPYLSIRSALRPAFNETAHGAERRLYYLLRAPRAIELNLVVAGAFASLLYTTLPSLYYGKSIWTGPWAALLVILLTQIMWVDIRLTMEKTLRPYVVAQFHQLQRFELEGSGFFWPRQKWYLPYLIGMYVVCTGAILATIFVRGADSAISELMATAGQLSPAQYEPALRTLAGNMWDRVETPLALLGLFLVVTAGASAWRLASYQSEGALSVQQAVAALASGSPRLPDWVGTDEVGDLAMATARVFIHLKRFSVSLGESARSLAGSAQALGTSTLEQNEVLVRQAAAIQETQVTAQEIKQTSMLASQKAESVMRQTEQADAISRIAEDAIERSVNSLQDIREHVQQMAHHIQELRDKARQIAGITDTVKGLADQSNMLALNAAIEAVRSGEQGKGFGVVAREIRTLANQSIRATDNVRNILEDIGTAINETVIISERGGERVNEGLAQVREFGNSVRQLSSMVRESGSSVRQISSAVSQQNTGIEEIFKSINEVSQAMDQTLRRLRASEDALSLVSSVSDKVSDFVRGYDWQEVQVSAQGMPPRAK